MKKLLILIAPTSMKDLLGVQEIWVYLNSDWPIQKVDFTKISVEDSMTH